MVWLIGSETSGNEDRPIGRDPGPSRAQAFPITDTGRQRRRDGLEGLAVGAVQRGARSVKQTLHSE